MLLAQFLRARAWWRLDSAGANALHVACSVVSLLDASGYVRALPDDDPAIAALDAAGCFTGGIFDPGPVGWNIVREWQLAEKATAGPEDLLAQLARAASHHGPTAHLESLESLESPEGPESLPASATPTITIPRQPGPEDDRVTAPGRRG